MDPRWSKKFSPQAEIHDYLVDVASHFRLFPHFRFNKAVTNCDWDETLQIWRVKTKDGDVFEGNFLISCCGELHVPFIPDFKGKQFNIRVCVCVCVLMMKMSTLFKDSKTSKARLSTRQLGHRIWSLKESEWR